jgi:hypothetical protein
MCMFQVSIATFYLRLFTLMNTNVGNFVEFMTYFCTLKISQYRRDVPKTGIICPNMKTLIYLSMIYQQDQYEVL